MNKFVCDCRKEYVPNVNKYKDERVKCSACIKNTKAAEIKAKCVKYLGARCKDCLFTGHPVAFDFDHKDPSKKDFKISGHYVFRWEELKKELDKCELRCCRCHRIRHYLEDHD